MREILKFHPIQKPTIWGLETWLVSNIKGDETKACNSSFVGMNLGEILKKFGKDLLGENNYKQFGNEFPLLIKIIDAHGKLSIQVHPNDEIAMRRHGTSGKNEMWYVLDAQKDSQLIAGFNKRIDKEEYKRKVDNGGIEEDLCKTFVHSGDCLYIPAGRVHSIGAGIKIAEIQQTSDVTYRLYDYGRKDANGNLRELHTELALDAINFEDVTIQPKTLYQDRVDAPCLLVKTPYFTTNKWTISQRVERLYDDKSFHIYIGISGTCCLTDPNGNSTSLNPNEALVVPASITDITFNPNGMCEMIECWV